MSTKPRTNCLGFCFCRLFCFSITSRLLHATDIESATLFDEIEETPEERKAREYREQEQHRDWLVLIRTMESLDEEVACAQFPDAFFAEKRDRDFVYVTELARQMCAGCPIKNLCRDYGIKHEDFGVWGGLTASQRSQIRHPRKDYTPAFLKQAK